MFFCKYNPASSSYLRELQGFANKVAAGDDLVRHKFIQSLPPTIAPVIASQKSLTLAQCFWNSHFTKDETPRLALFLLF